MKTFVPSGFLGFLATFQEPLISRDPMIAPLQRVILMGGLGNHFPVWKWYSNNFFSVQHFFCLISLLNYECLAAELASFDTETNKTTLCMVIAKQFSDERNLMAEGTTAEAIELRRTRSSLPILSDDSESSFSDHKQYVRGFNSATRATVTGGGKKVVQDFLSNSVLSWMAIANEKYF